MEAAKAQNWAVEPQGKRNIPLYHGVTRSYRNTDVVSLRGCVTKRGKQARNAADAEVLQFGTVALPRNGNTASGPNMDRVQIPAAVIDEKLPRKRSGTEVCRCDVEVRGKKRLRVE
jgi:hypothetical protein